MSVSGINPVLLSSSGIDVSTKFIPQLDRRNPIYTSSMDPFRGDSNLFGSTQSAPQPMTSRKAPRFNLDDDDPPSDSFISSGAPDENPIIPATNLDEGAQAVAEILPQIKSEVVQNNQSFPMVEPNLFMFSLLDVLNKVENNKDAIIDGMTDMVANATDGNGEKLFNSREKAKEFLRLLAYPNTRGNYPIPKSLYRSLNKVQAFKLTPLMKRQLNAMNRF